MCRDMAVPPSRLRGRMRRVTYLRADPEDLTSPVVGTLEEPEWTAEDRAALLGLAEYESSLCRCGQPKRVVWQVEGHHGVHHWECTGCTALARHEAELAGHENPSSIAPTVYSLVYRFPDAPEDLDDQPPLRLPEHADEVRRDGISDAARAAVPSDWLT